MMLVIAACLAWLWSARLRSMSSYSAGPREMTRGMAYFPRMLDKIRLHARGELGTDYHEHLGHATALDGACCNVLRVNYEALRERVVQGGGQEEIGEGSFGIVARVGQVDLFVLNAFA